MISAKTIQHAAAVSAELRRLGRELEANAILALIDCKTRSDRGLETLSDGPAIGNAPIEDGPVWEGLLHLAAGVPPEESEKLPRDLAEQPDHYLYGAPRRR